MAAVQESSVQTLERKGWHGLVVRLGRWRSVLLLTAFSVLASVLLTGIGMQLLGVAPRGLWQGYVLAVLVPAIVAPLATYAITGLVFQLDAARSALHQLAIRDSLTQAHNRRHFLEQLPLEVHRAQRSGQPLSLLMLDADHFKRVNDEHGHATGDEVLRALASQCRSLLRPYDLLVRYGGEEFVLLLIGIGIAPARDVAERLRATIADTPILSSGGQPLRLTVSIGVAELLPGETGGSALLERADAALYAAKNAGRNRWAG